MGGSYTKFSVLLWFWPRQKLNKMLKVQSATFLMVQHIYPGKDQLFMDNIKAAQYLEKWGYVPPSKTGSLVMPGEELTREMREALQMLQADAGITQTGEVDKETLELIGRARCGVTDRWGTRLRPGRLYCNNSTTMQRQPQL